MPRFIQLFRSVIHNLEVCVSDCHMTIWRKDNPPEEIDLTYPQSEKYFVAMRSGEFDYSLLIKGEKE